MTYGRPETWFWRVIGIFALTVCSLNVLVLFRGPVRMVNVGSNEVGDERIIVQDQSRNAVAAEEKTSNVRVKTEPPPRQVPGDFKKKPTAEEISASVKNLQLLRVYGIEQFFDPKRTITVGHKRDTKAYLTIGLPTVKREKAYYLPDTLRGLINGLSKQEHSEVVIVVFIADLDTGYQKKVEDSIRTLFPDEINDGLIHVVVPPRAYYPDFRNIPLFFHDSIARVHWRSKQTLDYSYLYFHSADLGKYFMQLEDDVDTEKNFLPEVKKFIDSKRAPWSTLEFGSRGFIGMTYESKNLVSLAKYCRMHFFLAPVDWLFRFFNDIWLHGNARDSVRKPPLFKHIGTFSSLGGQIRKLEDLKGPRLVNTERFYKGADNPPASLTTTISGHVNNYPVPNAYDGSMFWGKGVKSGDSITVTFKDPVVLKRVAIVSGSPDFPLDSLEDGEIFASKDDNGACGTSISINRFSSSPIVDVKDIPLKIPIRCLKFQLNSVRIDQHRHPRWLIVREIDVWVRK